MWLPGWCLELNVGLWTMSGVELHLRHLTVQQKESVDYMTLLNSNCCSLDFEEVVECLGRR